MSVLAPNGYLTTLKYRGADGIWRDLDLLAFTKPLPMQVELVAQEQQANTVGWVPGKQPVSTGKFTIRDVQPSATGFTFFEAMHSRGNASSFVGTNDSITNRVIPSGIIAVDLMIIEDLSRIQQASRYQIVTGCICRTPPNPSEADSGNTLEVDVTVAGTFGALVLL